jgi:hypothetical protein
LSIELVMTICMMLVIWTNSHKCRLTNSASAREVLCPTFWCMSSQHLADEISM